MTQAEGSLFLTMRDLFNCKRFTLCDFYSVCLPLAFFLSLSLSLSPSLQANSLTCTNQAEPPHVSGNLLFCFYICPSSLIGARQEEWGEVEGVYGRGWSCPSHSWKLPAALLHLVNLCELLQGCCILISAAAVKAADCLSPFLPAG